MPVAVAHAADLLHLHRSATSSFSERGGISGQLNGAMLPDHCPDQRTALLGEQRSRLAYRQVGFTFESTSAQASANSLFGPSAAGTVAQPLFMTKSRRS